MGFVEKATCAIRDIEKIGFFFSECAKAGGYYSTVDSSDNYLRHVRYLAEYDSLV